MRIFIFHRLYNSFGGHMSFTLAGNYLEFEMPNFGDAIDELEITLNFFHDGPAKKTLEKLQEQFHKNLTSLPKCTFYRKKRRLVLDVEAKFTTGYEIERNNKPPITINPEWVKNALDEMLNQFSVLKSKIKKSDNFDIDSFELYINKKYENIPSSVDELEKIKKLVSERKKQKFDNLGDWEKLKIDWGEYHPNAKTIVNQPFQWSEIDDFAPNGNDTGSDTLTLFKDWNKRNIKVSSITFLGKLLPNWDIDVNNPHESEYTSHTYFQCVVGLAFASLKLRGECEVPLKDMAISAIDKYLDDVQVNTNWKYLEECKQKLLMCKQTILNNA